jgi:predicted phage baseplate assembly protein
MTGCDALHATCASNERRELVRASGTLCGIDDIEVYDDGVTLCVRLFGTVPGGLKLENVVVTGGTRITGIAVTDVDFEEHEDEGTCLRVTLDRTGDFSAYRLCLVAPPATDDATCSFVPLPNAPMVAAVPAGVDPRYACAEFHFHLDCPSDDDCLPPPCGPEARPPDIAIDYLGRDFAGFRRLLIDRLALTMPDWQERHLPDLQISLVELLAYVGDRLSYQLDAVATEAYLGTARKRISMRRHARLLDYRMHEGCNARAFVCVEIDGGDLLDHLASDFLFAAADASDLSPLSGLVTPARLDGATLIFEPMSCAPDARISLRAAHSSISFHTWRQSEFCLPKGATRATLRDGARPLEGGAVRRLALQPGDLLILEEIRGAETGAAADADPAKRWPVRLTRVEELVDPFDGTLLLEVEWGRADALPFALRVSSWTAPDAIDALRLARGGTIVVSARDAATDPLPEGGIAIETMPRHGRATLDADGILTYTADAEFTGADIAGLSVITPAGASVGFTLTLLVGDAPYCRIVETAVARGNVILVDHGRTVIEKNDRWLVDWVESADCCRCEGIAADVLRVPAPFAMTLEQTPICSAAPAPCDARIPAAAMLAQDVRTVVAQVTLDMALDVLDAPAMAFPATFDWIARFDLLDSASDDRHFVVEIDDAGRAHLRFGDGECGAIPPAGARFRARYRVGNGRIGNVGAESIAMMALHSTGLDGISITVRNPLAAQGGTDPESIEEVRRRAPHAYGRALERAITALDYATIAGRDPRIQGAQGGFAWTGIGYEANVALDITAAHVRDDDLAASTLERIAALRRVGHDVAITQVRRVPLRIAAHVCVDPAYRRDDVSRAMRTLMSAGSLPDGTPAMFHPDRLVFGRDVHASRIVAAIQELDGVTHVELTRFSRLDDVKPGTITRLDTGVIPIADDEIAQCDSDPDFPERGSFSMRVVGGR